MPDTVISVENLSKRYRINTLRNQDTLFGQMRSLGSALFRRRRLDEESMEDFVWALRDLSFEVKRGEVLGIVGKNGSGKSTLLKLLSRIIRPTEGRISIRGRVASLLEVGTGFHPELSGRENIFMNAAILGMTRQETRRKFDEIVDFAEVGRFIDTPVKRYSSGMHTRLAFAVAAHLEPEILLIDEVLAVGDSNFQKKSLGKMNEVSSEGRTVLFVSHNMGAVSALCPRSILLSAGSKLMEGETGEIVKKYMELNTTARGEIIYTDENAPQSERIRLNRVAVVSGGVTTTDVDISKDITIEIDYETLSDGHDVLCAMLMVDKLGADVLQSGNMDSANLIRDEWFGRARPRGHYRTTCVIPGDFLNEGPFHLHIFLQTVVGRREIHVPSALTFTVYDTGSMREEYLGAWRGVVRPKLAWQTEQISEMVEG